LLAYGGLGLAVLLPLFAPGYILTLDLVFVPHLAWPDGWGSATALLTAVLHLLNLIVPSQIIEKLLLLTILTLAGLGMHRLVPTKNQWAKYAAGGLYVLNPFTYSRLMSGQYLVLAGYALMPWFVGALLRFVRRPEWGSAWRLGAWTLAIGFVSLHYLGFAAITAVIAVGLAVWRDRRHPPRLRQLAGWSGGVAGGVLALNSFWLIPLLTHRSAQASLIAGFDERFFLSFRTAGDATFGQMLNTLGLYGFWGDRQGLYILPKEVLPWWWVVALVILGLAALGAWKRWRGNRFGIGLMLGVLVVGWVLAQGIMGSPFAGLNHWLMNHMPWYRGYREPGKFIGLIALGVCYLFGLGVAWLLERSSRWGWKAEWLPGLLVAIPLAYTPTMLWGAGGQLHAVNYPADWYALERRLGAEHSGGKVLFLPWHQYMYFGFAGRLIANPAPRFFDRPTVAGDNAQIGLIERQSSNPLSERIERDILSADTGRRDLGPRLRQLGFEYVVLAKEVDYRDYAWLDRSPDLHRVSDKGTLRVYRVESEK
jgi:hypothetical protein